MSVNLVIRRNPLAPGRARRASYGGWLMRTSLSLLTLEVYYRHLPLYRRDMGGEKNMAAQTP